MKAIRIHDYGGPEVLKYEDAPIPEPGQGQVLVKVKAAGINFVDLIYRRGSYREPTMPFTPGREAAGIVHAVGPDVPDLLSGDRVAYAMVPGSYAEYPGSYAEYSLVPAWRVVKLPDRMDFRTGAAIMFQGLTAHFLSHSCFSLKSEHTALIHAGAGGVGLLLTQIATKIGTTVYTTVSSEAKAEVSRNAGAREVIVHSTGDLEVEIRRLTSGRGVDVVYDPIGKSTFEKSLNCLAIRGHMVLFGLASGPVGPVDPATLLRGSYSLTRPAFGHYVMSREELLHRTADLFRWFTQGDMKLRIHDVFPLKDAADAHRAIETGTTTGKVLLQP